MKEKREGGAMERTRKPVSSALSKAGFSRKNNRRGFTLAEVLIVVAIIAVLVAVAIPVFTGQLEKNRDSITATNLRAAYDEANATLLSRGQKPPAESAEPKEITVTVDGVAFETTDNKLSGEETSLPFTIPDTVTIPAKQTYSVVFHFTNQNTYTNKTYMTLGSASGSGGSDPIPSPTSEPSATPSPKRTVTGISISTNPKTIYNEGESFDSTGMKLTVTYDSGDPDYGVDTGYSCSNVGPYAIAGSYTVTVRYEGKTAPLTITVNKRTVEWIKITRGPDKDEYAEGEEFNPDGMVVTARFSDDSADSEPHIIPTTDYICRPASGDELTASVTCVTVSYEGQMDTWPITVGAPILKEITVDGAEFEEGETFDQSKLIVTANYNNARPKTVSISDCEILDLPTFSNPLQRGETYSFTVKYTEGEGEDLQEASADVTFTVKKAPLTGISVEVKDDYYHVGDTFTKSGLIVKANYKNDYVEYSEPLSDSDYVCTPNDLEPALNPDDPKLEEKNYKVTVTYVESEGAEPMTAETTFTVTNSTLTGLTVALKDSAPTYYVGDTVKKTDLTVTAKYENEHTKVLDDDAYILDNDTPLVKGTNTISVTYQDMPASTELTVDYAALTSVTVGIAKSYCVGDTFNESDVTATATYANDYERVLPASDYTVALSPADAKLKEDVTYTVTVTYNSTPYTTTFKPTKAPLKSVVVEVTKDYCVGDTFNESDVKVTATYENDFSETITSGYTVALSPNDSKLKENETYTVTVTYNGAPYTDTFTVENFAPLSSIAVVVTGTYYVGDTVDKSGLKVKATYANGHTKEIDDYTILNNTPLVKGTNTISVTYQEKPDSTELTVDYAALKGITVGIAKTYYVGDTFNKSDVTVTATYANDDYSETISSGYTVTLNPNDVPLQKREYEVTVTYNENPYKATFDVTYAAVVSIDFQFLSLDATTSFSEDNLLVTATYANGHSDTISTGYNYTLAPNHDPLQYSTTYTVTVTYPGVPSKSHDFTTPANPNSGGGGGICFAPGTLITLADGTQKPVEELTFDDKLLVWDFFTGAYASQPAVLIFSHEEDVFSVISLHFSDGTLFRIIGEHGVFDYDLNRFVYISQENAEDFIGHQFVKCAPEGGYDLVTLDHVKVTEELIEAWSVISSYEFNAFASDLLTLSHPAEVFDMVPMGETLRYDTERFQQIVAEYGTYDYEDLALFFTKEQFEALRGKYMKIFMTSGYMSQEEMGALLQIFAASLNPFSN